MPAALFPPRHTRCIFLRLHHLSRCCPTSGRAEACKQPRVQRRLLIGQTFGICFFSFLDS